MPDVLEINVSTGETIERDYTQEEILQIQKDKIENERIAVDLKQKYDEDVKNRNIIIDKLIAVGLSKEEAEKMIPKIDIDYRITHLI